MSLHPLLVCAQWITSVQSKNECKRLYFVKLTKVFVKTLFCCQIKLYVQAHNVQGGQSEVT